MLSDFSLQVLTNTSGELCNHYPSKIVVLEYETSDTHSHHESIYNMHHMQELFSKSRFARCRTRFVAPVILVEGRVCVGIGFSVYLCNDLLVTVTKIINVLLAYQE